ncbi:MAG: STAS domain-containing protein [Phycisphaerales bacterium]
MAVSEWSERIIVADLQDEPQLSDDLNGITERVTAGTEPPDVVLDFGAVSYVNSSNLAQLIRLRRELKDRGRLMRMCSVNERVWSVLLTSNLDRLFNFEVDKASALASLQLAHD